VLFHDAVDTGGYGNVYPGVARLVAEIDAGWERQAAQARSRTSSGCDVVDLIAVVLNWNGGDDTLDALASLDGVPTICVDNGSTDGSDERVADRFARSSCCAQARTSALPAATTPGSGVRWSAAPTGSCS